MSCVFVRKTAIISDIFKGAAQLDCGVSLQYIRLPKLSFVLGTICFVKLMI